jgi:hypothetical protein
MILYIGRMRRCVLCRAGGSLCFVVFTIESFVADPGPHIHVSDVPCRRFGGVSLCG